MTRTIALIAITVLTGGCSMQPWTADTTRAEPVVTAYKLTPTIRPACECLARQYDQNQLMQRRAFSSKVNRLSNSAACEIVSSDTGTMAVFVTLVTDQADGTADVEFHIAHMQWAEQNQLPHPQFIAMTRESAAKCGKVD